METVTWGKGNSDSGSESWPRNAAGPTQEKTSLQKPQILRPLTKACLLYTSDAADEERLV